MIPAIVLLLAAVAASDGATTPQQSVFPPRPASSGR